MDSVTIVAGRVVGDEAPALTRSPSAPIDFSLVRTIKVANIHI